MNVIKAWAVVDRDTREPRCLFATESAAAKNHKNFSWGRVIAEVYALDLGDGNYAVLCEVDNVLALET